MFTIDTRLIYGPGSTTELIELVAARQWQHAVVLIDDAVERTSPHWQQFRTRLTDSLAVEVISLSASAEPTYAYLDEVAALVRALPEVDVIVGIGGGSVLDVTKAAAALRTNPGPALDYRGFDKVLAPAVATICIPTTAGTGSEVTINAVFTDDQEMRKLGINGLHMSATYAVLDANWTASCPRNVAMSSGLDALVHSLESFMTHKSTQVTRLLSANAFGLIYSNLPGALNDPQDTEALQSMLLGSYFAAAALFNSGSGISGAISYPVGVHFHVPHGIAGGITLPSVIRFNAAAGWHGFGPLLSQIEPIAGLSPEEQSDRFIMAIDRLYDDIRAPRDFSQWGLSSADLDRIAELVAPLQGAFDQNPVPFSGTSDARALVARHLS